MKKIVSLSIAIMLLFVFAGCGGGRSTEAPVSTKTLSMDEFSFYLDGKETVKLDTSSDSEIIDNWMSKQNEADGVTYATKRGIAVGADSSEIIAKYSDMALDYSIMEMKDFNNKTLKYTQEYKTVKDFIENESRMDLTEDDYLFISCKQFEDSTGVYTKAQADERCGYKDNMTDEEREAYQNKLNQYDLYSLNFHVKDGKIIEIGVIFMPGELL